MSLVSSMIQPRRTVRRYREIVAVFMKHGFEDLVERLNLERYVALGRRMLFVRRRPETEHMTRAQRLRSTLEELGPTFVKFGQALSTRADLLSPDFVAELSRLQDRVPPLPPGTAETAIELELGQPVAAIFQWFDPVPFGSASIAQVHRARLVSGEEVAVKVRRPGIAAVIESDLTILSQLAHLTEHRIPEAELYSPAGLVNQFARTIRREQDLAREGRLIERFTRNFAEDRTMYFPRVYWPQTAPGVLTLEYVKGAKVSELVATEDGALDRHLIARRGADAVLKQVLVHGLFHADPHPGNILVLPDNVVCLIDFGIVGRLEHGTREILVELVRAITQQDAERLARRLVEVAEPLGEVSVPELTRDLAELLDSYSDARLGDLRIGEMWRHTVDGISRHRLKFPADLMLLVKALVTIEGVGRQLDPSFKMMDQVGPFVARLLQERLAPAVVAARISEAGREAAEALRAVPREVSEILHKTSSDRLQIQVVHRDLEHVVKKIERSGNRLSFAVVIGALVIGSSLLLSAGAGLVARASLALGLLGLGVAVIFAVGLTVGVLRSGRL